MTSDKSEMSKSKKQREYQFYMEMFSQLLDIVDAISTQMFEKVSVIPYSIRQFCKLLFKLTIDKFGGKDQQSAIRLVAHFLLKNWLLKACFQDLHIEGLTKEFYLANYCRKNLQLTMDILYSIMTFQDWEVPTPPEQKLIEQSIGMK